MFTHRSKRTVLDLDTCSTEKVTDIGNAVEKYNSCGTVEVCRIKNLCYFKLHNKSIG